MEALYNYLQKQLKDEAHKKDAEDCLKIYEKLKELNDGGSVWASQWNPLVEVHYEGFPSDNRTYKPSNLGYIFLKGIEEKKEQVYEARVRYIPVQIVIMSHLSDAQELLTIGIGREGKEDAIKRINFAKYLLIKFGDNISQEVSEDELNKIWSELK